MAVATQSPTYSRATRTQRMGKAIRKSRAAYLLMLPFLLHFIFVVAWPMFYSVYLGFTEARLNADPVFVGFDNFTSLADDTEFRAAIGNTFYFAFFAVLGETILPLIVALIMNMALRGRVIFRTAFFLPLAKPGVATLAVFTFISSWDDLLWPMVIAPNPNMRTIHVGLAFIRQTAMTPDQVLAAIVVVSIPVIIAFLLGQRYFVSGITAGAVKE